MQLFLQTSAGSLLVGVAGTISYVAQLAIDVAIGVMVVLVLIRWLMDAMQTNPFGRVTYYLRRPTDGLIGHVRNSRFYYPIRQAVKFNPAILMALVALVIVWYVTLNMIGQLMAVFGDLAFTLDAFGNGRIFNGVSALIGTLLMIAILFLMGLMVLIFINWVSGLFEYASFWALHRIGPLLRVFEFRGTYAGWSFLILWLVLYLAAFFVQAIFFRSLQQRGTPF